VVEDCAQAYLARHRGQTLGAIGDIGCFSLQQGKHITTGEGGFVTTSRTDLEIEVLSTSDEGYVVSWTQGETRFDDPEAANNALVRRMANLLAGYRIILALDPEAAIEEVRNWKELKETVDKVADTLSRELRAGGLDESTVDKVIAQVTLMYATRERLEQLSTREAQMFFLVLGVELSQSEPLEYEDRLPNPLGGRPIPSRARFELKGVDRASDEATITWTQTVAPPDLRQAVEKWASEMAARLGKPLREGQKPSGFTMQDEAEYTLDMSTGWVRTFSHERTVKTNGSVQIDTLTIVRKGRGQ
jgi:hypothetical protein